MNTNLKINESPRFDEVNVKELQDSRWVAKQNEILTRDNFQCVLCQSQADLVIHHRQYHFSKVRNSLINSWEYPSELLVTLCEGCHENGHHMHFVPTKYIM